MALGTPTLLDSATSTSGASSDTSASISPTANALLMVHGTVAASSGSRSVDSVTDTLTGTGSWTIVYINDTGSSSFVEFIVYAIAGSAPGSGTITVNYNANCTRRSVGWSEITGIDSGTPVPQNKTGSGTGDQSATLDSAPASDSATVGAMGAKNDSDGITPGSGFTEILDANSGGVSTQARHQFEYDITSPDATVDASDFATLNNQVVALEIAAAAAAGIEVFRRRIEKT